MIHNFFPIPVYEFQGSINETFLIQDEIRKTLPTIFKTDKFENPVGWNDGVQTNIKQRYNTIVDFKLTNLHNFITSHVKKYIVEIGAYVPIPVELSHSWVNVTQHSQNQNWHNHQDALISGTYYFQTNETDGDLIFKNAVPFVGLETFPAGVHCQKTQKISPQVGKLVLFPGWLEHQVDTNHTNNTRISISFNFHGNQFFQKTA
jgi:uncharacterized protein (TIGR02466 family)